MRGQTAIAQAKAAEVLRQFRIESVGEIDIDAIAFARGLEVVSGGLGGARGRLVSRGGRGRVRIAHDVSGGQRRFILAHELGHHLLHSARGRASICAADDLVRYESQDPESEANRFATDLLMPKHLFEKPCDTDRPSLQLAEKLAQMFGTTLTAAAIRLVDCCPVPCALVWSEAGKVKWAVRGPEFFGWIASGQPLDPSSYAFDACRGTVVRDAPQLVSADAWVERLAVEEIYEHTRWFSSLRASLTLLWIPA